VKCEISAFTASGKNPQNKPSTQPIKATSCIYFQHATIGAEELTNFSSYQTPTMKKKW
jgi:hypothetical protein